MGWFGKLKGVASRALGSVGGTIKKVADFTAPVVRKVAQMARPIADGIAGISMAMGQPEIALIAKGVSKAADWVGNAAPKVQNAIDKAGAFGTKMQGMGAALGG